MVVIGLNNRIEYDNDIEGDIELWFSGFDFENQSGLIPRCLIIVTPRRIGKY